MILQEKGRKEGRKLEKVLTTVVVVVTSHDFLTYYRDEQSTKEMYSVVAYVACSIACCRLLCNPHHIRDDEEEKEGSTMHAGMRVCCMFAE